jgi:hypothetical protein
MTSTNQHSKKVYYTYSLKDFDKIAQHTAVVLQRSLSNELDMEITYLMQKPHFQVVKIEGSPSTVVQYFQEQLSSYPYLLADILQCLQTFVDCTKTTEIRVSLVRITTDMCRKFHTDIVDYRLLCTYKGIGTYFVAPENTQQSIENTPKQEHIEQLLAGEAILFRGAMSATTDTPPLVHKSPPIAEKQQERLLLRIDTNSNFF